MLAALILPVASGRAGAFGVPLQTGIDVNPNVPEREQTLTHVRAVGAQFLRVTFSWDRIAPANPPPGFEPANPDDPAYQWGDVDRTLAAIVARGLTPLVGIDRPPIWGQSPLGAGEDSPDPSQLALFTRAFAARYDGSRPGLPWVRYWEVWNEVNASYFLQPQLQGSQIVSVDTYRTMLNDVATAVHGVRPDDVVVGGALFPNGLQRPTATAIAPLEFMRDLFCLSPGPRPHRTCNAQVDADAISVHPYTSGGPSTLPANPDDVWIDNLGSLSALVRSAQRLGALVSSQPAQVWVTEFSWASNPPRPQGVPIQLERRWVAETLYRSWQAGISVFTWYSLRDERLATPPQQEGLYFECPQGIYCDTPKPTAAAFRFPFVAYTSSRHRVLVWGRTPVGAPGTVQIQWQRGRRWRTLATLGTDGDGIFTARPALPRAANPKSALLRAVLDGSGEASPAFSLHRTPDILVTPFGT
ncbi:MAG TPA: hypothetical protein VG053_00135 [Solirubrobacteraceae bacterium]|nr:hypothetical protein [Solirubrobacteraceae bacterium]